MYLKIKDYKNIEKCMENCPISQNPKILNCRHCENPVCAQVCPNDAFVEISKGVWKIDPEACDGCGKCAEVCPYGAIVIEEENNKKIAKKCDFCYDLDFSIQCKGCTEWTLSEKERNELKKILGWYVCDGEYVVKLPRLTLQEAHLINYVISQFRDLNIETPKEEHVANYVDQFCEEEGINLSEKQRKYVFEILKNELFHYGPMTYLLEDPNVEEIAIINEKVRVYKRKEGWKLVNFEFLSSDYVKNVVNKLIRGSGKILSDRTPRINSYLRDGSRLHAVMEPITKGISVTIRKFSSKPILVGDLVNFGTFSKELADFFDKVMKLDINLLIAGNTGSGKTTTLNALFHLVPRDERIVLVEETPEINIPHPHKVNLKVVPDLGVDMGSLVVDTLRMRPDRVIVGEIRNKEEVFAYMDTVLAGQGRGSYATFHALSAKEAIKRLKKLGVMEEDILAIDLILVQRRWKTYVPKPLEKRVVWELAEINESPEGGIELNYLFKYDFQKEKIVKMNDPKRIQEKIKSAGLV